MKKEGRKERKGKKRREGGGSRPWPVVAGGGRRWPEVAGDGRPKTQAQAKEGASLVQNGFLEFCKRNFGERSNSSSERA